MKPIISIMAILAIVILITLTGCENPVSFDKKHTADSPLQIINIVPTSNIPIDTTQIVVSFSATLDAQTISSSSVQVLQGASRVPINIKVAGSKVLVSPVSNLAYATTYTGVVTTSVRDANGDSLPAQYSWNFTTESVKPLGLDGGYSVSHVTIDDSGNTYVCGQLANAWGPITSTLNDFVAKISSDRKLIWIKQSTSNCEVAYSIAVMGGKVYLLHLSGATAGSGYADVFVDCYDGSTGKLLASVKTAASDMPDRLIVSGNFIYAVSQHMLAKLNQGCVLQEYSIASDQPPINDAVILSDGVLLCGGYGTYVSFVRKLDANFQVIWNHNDNALFSFSAITYFPQDSTLITAETFQVGTSQSGMYFLDSLAGYRVSADGNMTLLWKKQFGQGISFGIRQYDASSCYVYAGDIYGAYSLNKLGPVKLDLHGNTLWAASPAANGEVALFGGCLFVATGGNTLTVYNN